jgi:hypothetical protein
MELKNAYPKESSLVRFVRTGELKDGEIRITDDFELTERKKISFHFMTADRPAVSESGVIRLNDRRNLYYDGNTLEAVVEEIQIEDPTIVKNWSRESVYRIILSADNLQKNKFVFTIK